MAWHALSVVRRCTAGIGVRYPRPGFRLELTWQLSAGKKRSGEPRAPKGSLSTSFVLGMRNYLVYMAWHASSVVRRCTAGIGLRNPRPGFRLELTWQLSTGKKRSVEPRDAKRSHTISISCLLDP